MNVVKAYKEKTGLTLKQLAEEFKTIQPGIDAPTISRIITGAVRPNAELESYISEKVFAISSDGLLEQGWTITSLEEEILSNSRFSEVYQLIKAASKSHPVTYPQMQIRTGKSQREIQSLIAEMRKKGVPITSYTGKTGFWLAEDEQDMHNLIGMFEKQGKESLYIASILKNNCGGQLRWAERLG